MNPAEVSRSPGAIGWQMDLVWTAIVAFLVGGTLWVKNQTNSLGADSIARPAGMIVIPDFRLTERSGRTITRADLERRFVVMNLVFTGCDSSCIRVNLSMAELQERLAGEDDVTLLSLTVDPRSDTPAVLTRFASRFRADPSRWLFLTGDKSAIYPLIEHGRLNPTLSASQAKQPSDFKDLRHVALFDPEGILQGYFDGSGSGMPNDVLKAIRRLRVSGPVKTRRGTPENPTSS